MKIHPLTTQDYWKAIGIGVFNGVLLAALNIIAVKMGVSAFPKPLALAFAVTVIGMKVPLWIGLLFHVAYVTFWSVAYVVLFRDRLTLASVLGLTLVIWLLVQVVFFPVVGWGFFGLGIGVRVTAWSVVPHLLFALFLWVLSLMSFTPSATLQAQREGRQILAGSNRSGTNARDPS